MLLYAFHLWNFRPFSVLDQHLSTACHSLPFSVSSQQPSRSDCSWLITYLFLNLLAPSTGPDLTKYIAFFLLLALACLHYLATSFRIGGLYWYFAASRPFLSSLFIRKLYDINKYKYSYGSFYVSVKLPTYPSPKPTLTLSSYLGKNIGLGEGRWAVSQKRKMTLLIYSEALLGVVRLSLVWISKQAVTVSS